MESILTAIHDGTFDPCGQIYNSCPDAAAFRKMHDRHYQDFVKKLSPEQKASFRVLWDEYNESMPYASREAFVCGVRMGVQLMVECMTPLDYTPPARGKE